eukprot:GFUD01010616.1.p1 GENE.GFUD01010616.1~~GFUD01010616.1.p1  ORF type:complete len:106 (+),score=12.52 GFUD01010616.1:405-722(+)
MHPFSPAQLFTPKYSGLPQELGNYEHQTKPPVFARPCCGLQVYSTTTTRSVKNLVNKIRRLEAELRSFHPTNVLQSENFVRQLRPCTKQETSLLLAETMHPSPSL